MMMLNGPLRSGLPASELVGHCRLQSSPPSANIVRVHGFSLVAFMAAAQGERGVEVEFKTTISRRRSGWLLQQMAKEPLAALAPHAIGNRVSHLWLFQKLQLLGTVLVAHLKFLDKRLDRLNVNALVASAVGQE